jgi:uncharacterized protein YndB with AHSA1/START domain
MIESLVVRREIQVAAPPATVFAFLTDPEKILRWMGTEATLEPHPGGLYLVNVTGTNVARGRFTEVIPVHRLAYSFGWEGGEAGRTLLRLTHSGLPDAAACASHEKGWSHYLERLSKVASGGDAGPDPRLA